MKILREFVARKVAGEYLLVPVGKTNLDLNGMITLNEVGAFLWERLPEAESESELVEAVLAEYEAERAEVSRDVAAFLTELRTYQII